MCMCVYVSMCTFAYVSMCMGICVHVSLRICVCVRVCVCVSRFLCVYLCMSVRICVYVSVSGCMPLCHVCLCVGVSVCLRLCMSTCISMCHPFALHTSLIASRVDLRCCSLTQQRAASRWRGCRLRRAVAQSGRRPAAKAARARGGAHCKERAREEGSSAGRKRKAGKHISP